MSYLSFSVFICMMGLAVLAWLLPKRWQAYGVAVCSALYLAWYSPVSLLILSLTSLLTFYLGRVKQYLTAAILSGIGVVASLMVYYKLQLTTDWIAEMGSADVVMPLGLSYYAFRQIHYLLEQYKNGLRPHTLGEYLCYLFFLPTMLAGPINRFGEFKRDLSRRRWDLKLASEGLERILYGYVKIVFLGNYLVSLRFEQFIEVIHAQNLALAAYLDCVRYGLNLYFQFGGYSDIAIGLSLIMGFRIVENFNYPFVAPNINNFWQRWHISLSDWCKDYVFMPVASYSRKPVLAILASMMVLGLWHELSWKYVVWALYHGLGIAVWHMFQKVKTRLPNIGNKLVHMGLYALSVLFTLNFVMLSFALTKEPDLAAGIQVWKTILGIE